MSNKIFYDFEFLEGTQTKRILGIPYGQTKPTIDVISVGMVSEDGREYYAVSKDFNLWEAWNRYDYIEGRHDKFNYWIRENVLKPIYVELATQDRLACGSNDSDPLTNRIFPMGQEAQKVYVSEMQSALWDTLPPKTIYKFLKRLINKYGKTNKQIADEITEFCYGFAVTGYPIENTEKIAPEIELYGYYSAYDHVALCWLFGKMIDLPKGFPMYTRDLKQMLDEKAENLIFSKRKAFGVLDEVKRKENGDFEYVKKYSFEERIDAIKKSPNYPKQTNEHNSLADAKWNGELYKFIQSI